MHLAVLNFRFSRLTDPRISASASPGIPDAALDGSGCSGCLSMRKGGK